MTKKNNEGVREIKHFFRHNNALNRGHGTKIIRTFDQQISESEDQEFDIETQEEAANAQMQAHCMASKCSKIVDRVFLLLYILCLSLGTKELFKLHDHTSGYITWFSGLIVILGIYIIKARCYKCSTCSKNKQQ